MKLLRITLCLFVAVGVAQFFPLPFAFAESQQIAAIVNEDAISIQDLNERMQLIMASSGIPNKPEIREKLAPQIMNTLIEEQIMLQEAKKMELTVEPTEIEKGFATIAEQNKMKAEDFKKMIKKGGLSLRTLSRQIEAQISWAKVVQAKLRPRVTVTERDVDEVISNLGKGLGKTEYLLAEIFLPVDDAKSEGEARQLAQGLIKEMRSGRAIFSKLAQQFSKSAGSMNGGSLGWVPEGQLSPEMQSGLKNINKNQVSDPIRSSAGFHILLLRDKRTIAKENMPTREQAFNKLGTERLDRLQRGYLLDLKSSSFIDNRVSS